MRELLTGSQAIVRGALHAGCDFFDGDRSAGKGIVFDVKQRGTIDNSSKFYWLLVDCLLRSVQRTEYWIGNVRDVNDMVGYTVPGLSDIIIEQIF